MKFGYEIIQEKREKQLEELKAFKASEDLYNIAYDVGEEFKNFDACWFSAVPSNRAVYFWAGTFTRTSIVELIDFVFDYLDPICEEAGLKMNVNRTRIAARSQKIFFTWVSENLGTIEIEVNTQASCKRIVTGQKLVDKVEYVCNG